LQATSIVSVAHEIAIESARSADAHRIIPRDQQVVVVHQISPRSSKAHQKMPCNLHSLTRSRLKPAMSAGSILKGKKNAHAGD